MSPTSMGDLPRTIHAMPQVTIFGPAICPNCKKAMDIFDRNKIEYQKIDIEAGDKNHKHITEDLGYQTAPVVVVKFENKTVHWGGHRMDMLTALVRLCKTITTAESEDHE